MHRRTDWVLEAVERYERPLLKFVSALVGPLQAQDIVQDVFLKLCQEPRAAVEDHLAAWLFTVAKRGALDSLRRRQRRQLASDPDLANDLEGPDSGPQIKLERQQALTRAAQLLQELPEREREALLLKLAGGLSYQQIADAMQLSVGNVGFILHTALKSLRAGLAAELSAGGGAR